MKEKANHVLDKEYRTDAELVTLNLAELGALTVSLLESDELNHRIYAYVCGCGHDALAAWLFLVMANESVYEMCRYWAQGSIVWLPTGRSN